MTNNWSICPGVLCIQAHGAILINDHVKGLVKPPERKKKKLFNSLTNNFVPHNLSSWATSLSAQPVIALSMEQGLGIAAQRVDWVFCIVALLCVVQGYKEGRFLYGIQGLLVLTAAEVSFTSLCPGSPAKWYKKKKIWYVAKHAKMMNVQIKQQELRQYFLILLYFQGGPGQCVKNKVTCGFFSSRSVQTWWWWCHQFAHCDLSTEKLPT